MLLLVSLLLSKEIFCIKNEFVEQSTKVGELIYDIKIMLAYCPVFNYLKQYSSVYYSVLCVCVCVFGLCKPESQNV